MTRLRTFFLFAALLALAGALSACGGGSSDEDPQKVVDNATLEGVESGELDLSLSVNVEGEEGGNLDLSLSGPFQAEKGKAPELDLTAEASGEMSEENIDFSGGLTLLPGQAFVSYEGTDYEVDPTTYSFVESALQQAESQGEEEGESAGATACQEAATGLEVGSFVDNLSNDGSADVGGASTTKISGDLDVAGAIDAISGLLEDPACAAQFGAAGVPSAAQLDQAKSVAQEAIKTAHVDLYVGDDNIIRRVNAQLSIEAPKEEAEGVEKVDLEFELSLNGVNESQSISAPSNAKPLKALFSKIGVNPLELAGALSGGGLSNPEELLEDLGGSSSGSSSGGGGSSSGGNPQAYLECVGESSSAAELQRCEGLLE